MIPGIGRSPRAVGVLAIGIATIFVIQFLAKNDWDPSAFTAFGEESVAITHYAEDLLNRDVVTREGLGHDGRFFFVQANDPFLLDPGSNGEILDRPRYRSQRMLYPLLAGAGGLLAPEMILWGLLLVNVVMIGIGSWAVAGISSRFGASALAGLAFVLNPGILNEFFIDGAGILAFALVCLGAWALQADRYWPAIALFTAAALTREVMLVFGGALVVVWWLKRRQFPWGLALVPVGATGAWYLYTLGRLPTEDGAAQVLELVAVPFSGLIDAMDLGVFRPAEVIVAVAVLALCVLVPVRALRSEIYLSWGAIGFAVLAPFLSAFVWSRVWDISRAVLPLFTVYVLQVVVGVRARTLRDRTGRRS